MSMREELAKPTTTKNYHLFSLLSLSGTHFWVEMVDFMGQDKQGEMGKPRESIKRMRRVLNSKILLCLHINRRGKILELYFDDQQGKDKK